MQFDDQHTVARCPYFVIVLAAVIAIGLSAPTGASAAMSLADAVAGARGGHTITLNAGTYVGSVTLPPGVSLRGAGYGKTTVDASGLPFGVEISGGTGASISDLCVKNSTRIDISVHDSTGTIIRRVRANGSINGIVFSHVTRGRIENVVSDNNRYGIVAGGGAGDVVVNCTSAMNSGLGISVPTGTGTIVFNNCVTDTATGIYVGLKLANAHIDHNLYSALYSGKLEGQLGRKDIGEWNSLSGCDAHSFANPVTYAAPDNGVFRPINALSWSLNRTPVTGFGVETYAGAMAPGTDIDGNSRTTPPDIGAYNADLGGHWLPQQSGNSLGRAMTGGPVFVWDIKSSHSPRMRQPDGYFTVKPIDGVTSAGVFTKQGRLIAYLFHNLPLAHGRYPFWLPSRDFQYAPIAAGDYEVRVTQSALKWTYLGMIGDTGKEWPYGADAPIGAARLGFDDAGHLLAGNDGWAEDFIDVRGYDGDTGKFDWTFRAGADTKGIVVASNGSGYILRGSGNDERLTRLNPASGEVQPWMGGGLALPIKLGPINGLTELNGQLIVTDGSKVYFGAVDKPDFARTLDLPGASYPSADTKSGVVWILGDGGKVSAFKADGSPVAVTVPVDGISAIAVRSGRMAVASNSSGKIVLLDCSDSSNLKKIGSIGTGDGPYGAFAPDRFTFQGSSYGPSLAVGPAGETAVGDGERLIVFDSAGKVLWYSYGYFGNGTTPSYGTVPRRYEGPRGWSMALDLKNDTWRPEAYWDRSKVPGTFLGETSVQDHNFGVYFIDNADNHGSAPQFRAIEFTRIDGFSETPVEQIYGRDSTWSVRKDTNHDGIIDDKDLSTPLPTDGLGFGGYHAPPTVRPGGDLVVGSGGNNLATLWHCTGLDADGAPIYDPAKAVAWKSQSKPPMISPYTGAPSQINPASIMPLDDGSLGALLYIDSAPGKTGLFNGAGTDLAAFDTNGAVRWIHPLAQHKGLYNFQAAGPVYVSGVGQTTEIECVDRDGLGLGTFGQCAASHYSGYWLDHPGACQTWRGQDGHYYILITDNYNGCGHWYRLTNEDAIVRTSSPVNVSAQTAATLASLPAPDPSLIIQRPSTPTVILPRLKGPMPIDGDLAKWRAAGITPNIIITPDTATGGIDGPLDASAVIRMAYFGTDLYVQILRFDNNPVFFQPITRHYLQDCVEMCINGFGPGFKFDISKTTDAGDIIIRQRFFYGNLERLLASDHAPRYISILPSAKDVPERGMIESVYGVDLSPDKVVVSEFKLPMDAVTYEGDEKAIPDMSPGKSFWLGFMLDDNDQPGADLQNFMVWPATYATFNPPEDGARAILGP